MRTFLLVGMALTACGAAWAETPVEAFAGLVGSCWSAGLDDGASDTHCFTVATGGKLVMDVHKVRNRAGAVVYEGVTTYRIEKASGTIRYDYFNSMGDLMSGYAVRDGQRIQFPEKPDQPAELVWRLGPDAYEVGPAAETAGKRKFVKVGPAGEGGL